MPPPITPHERALLEAGEMALRLRAQNDDVSFYLAGVSSKQMLFGDLMSEVHAISPYCVRMCQVLCVDVSVNPGGGNTRPAGEDRNS